MKQEQFQSLFPVASAILAQRFIVTKTPDFTSFFEIVNEAAKEVRVVRDFGYVTAYLAPRLAPHVHGFTPTASELRLLAESWADYSVRPNFDPAPFAWSNEDVWSYKKLNFSPEPGSYPAWEEFLSRLSAPQDFQAFSWSIYEARHRGRQACYLYGPNGQDGKSSVLSALTFPFGDTVYALTNAALKNTRFLSDSLIGHRVVLYADCKNPNVLMSEIFRNITSGDKVVAERKGGASRSLRMYLRMMVASNQEPAITSGGADKSRLIRIDVEPSLNTNDPTWVERLEAELPYYLHACREIYQEKCPNHGEIQLEPITIDLVDEAADSFEEEHEAVFDQLFIADPQGWVSASNLHEALNRAGLKDTRTIGNFKDYLRKRHLSTRQRYTLEGRRVHVYPNIRLKEGVIPSDHFQLFNS